MTSALDSATLLPGRAPRIFEDICSQVREQMAKGVLRPGDKLPAERELAEQLGSSRTAVREALRSLEMAGIVELRKGVKGGAFIREGDPGVVTRSFGDMVNLGRISLESLTESRVIIQDAVVRLACQRGTADDFDALERSIERTWLLTQQELWEERRFQLVQFYRLLAQATRNEVMVIIVDALTDIVLRILARDETVPRAQVVKVQQEIVRCLRRRDADKAVEIMSRHLTSLNDHLLESAKRRAQRLKTKAASKPEAKNPAKASAKSVTTPRRRRVAPA
ncbi:MAG: hypothetical protein RI949_1566 [Pseudomonadota bacterium]|jgi:GntR family transcriptional regulator, transcriptional repressor for pyruvate dehydrogenase complex